VSITHLHVRAEHQVDHQAAHKLHALVPQVLQEVVVGLLEHAEGAGAVEVLVHAVVIVGDGGLVRSVDQEVV
jgi:hypothetical protein